MSDYIDSADQFNAENPDAPAKEPLEVEIIDRAVAQMRTVARGNGVISGQITAKVADGEVLNFEGLSYFKIEPKTAEKRVPGKERGQVVGSAGDLRAKVKAEVEKATANPDVRRHTVAVMKRRKDLGILVENQYVTLDKLRQVFVVHEACGPCGHDGKTSCHACAGKGRTKCKRCFGTKEMPCPLCRGTKVVGTPQGQAPCTRCQRRGRVRCTKCRNTGSDQCPQCRGIGQIKCQNCNGTGWHSLIGTLDIRAKSHFEYDKAALPQGVAEQIDALGPRVITEKHMQAAFIEDEGRFQQLAQISKPDEYIIPYHLRLPVGTITFALPKKQEVSARIFGFAPVLMEVEPFLETPLAPALAALERAAGGRAGALREATRARFVGETVMTVLKHPHKKALFLLQKRYPIGISAATLEKTVTHAEKVVHAIIAGPRRLGMLAGSVMAAGLFAAYFLTPARDALVAAVAQQNAPTMAMDIADAAVMIGGGLLGTAAAQILATRGVRRALGKLAAKVPARQLAPQAVAPLLIGFVIAVLSFGALAEAALWQHRAAPSWYNAARMKAAAHIALPAPPAKETAAPGTE